MKNDDHGDKPTLSLLVFGGTGRSAIPGAFRTGGHASSNSWRSREDLHFERDLDREDNLLDRGCRRHPRSENWMKTWRLLRKGASWHVFPMRAAGFRWSKIDHVDARVRADWQSALL